MGRTTRECTVYKAETHEQVLASWRTLGATGLNIVHLDFHCDMRGLLIDRHAGRAYRVWDMNPSIGQGNFLTHAIMEGRVSSIHWVHDEPGGRQYDVGTVAYESDLTIQPQRWLLALRGQRGVPLCYQVTPYARWTGPDDREQLDIDWDLFASTHYEADTIPERVETFFHKEYRAAPAQVYVCYSPQFCHPSREQFDAFADRLALMFEASVIDLPTESPAQADPAPWYKRSLPPTIFRLCRRVYYGASLSLRRRGIY